MPSEPVEFCKDYLVYPDGRVWNKKRKRFQKLMRAGNYFQVSINNHRMSIHRIVATCFIPNHLTLPQVNHKDFDTSNNDQLNLEWCTGSYNTRHAYDAGRASGVKGQKNVNSKLKDWQVKAIRFLHQYYPSHYSTAKLGKAFNYSQPGVVKIINRKIWGHI